MATILFYESDFTLLETITDIDGNEIDPRTINFVIAYYTDGQSKYQASHKNGKYVNCTYDAETGKLLVIFAKHGLRPGILNHKLMVMSDDSLFPLSIRNDKSLAATDITLALTGGDAYTAESTLVVPAMQITHSATQKDNIKDADEFNYLDSGNGFGIVKTTMLKAKAFFKTFYDTIYAPIAEYLTSSSELEGLETNAKTITGSINEVRRIVLGATPSWVFDTEAAMEAWLAVPENVAKLQTGNNLLIRELSVPDYWWDGEQAMELEVKIDLTNYYNKTEIGNLLSGTVMGASASTDNSLVRFDGLNGKTIQDSGVVVDDKGYTGIGKEGATLRNMLNIAGNMSFDPVVDPTNLETSGMTLSINGAGNVPIGTYYYAVVFSTLEGDTKACAYASFPSIVISSPSSVLIQNIPVSSDPRVIKRKIYRSQAGTVGDIYYLYYIGYINDNTTTSFLDNSAKDVTPRDWVLNKNNTTSGIMYLGTQKMVQVTDYITGVGINVFAANVSGTTCAAFGSDALKSVTSGSSNHAFGYMAGAQITTGSDNVCMGYAALQWNQTGSSNVAIGNSSLRNETAQSYSQNSALGGGSLNGLTGNNNNNVGVGFFAGKGSQGSNNIFIGAYSGNRTVGATVGNYNVILGYLASQKVFSHYNVLLGALTETLNTTDQNSIVIGYNAIGNGTNTVTIGNDNIADTYLKGRTHVTSSIQINNDTASASAANAGAIRYRADANNSYVEMCMQTGASTYAWVIIKQNTW